MIGIDFNEVYAFTEISADLQYASFDTETTDGRMVSMKVNLKFLDYPLLPDVYNLSFGPVDSEGMINDMAIVSHANAGKVFSTIITFALTFPGTKRQGCRWIGRIDGIQGLFISSHVQDECQKTLSLF